MIDAEAFITQHGLAVGQDAGGDVSETGLSVDADQAHPAIPAQGDDAVSQHHDRHSGRRTRRSSWGTHGTSRQKTPDDPCDIDACREAALRLLDCSDRSSHALRERLIGKGYDETVADSVVVRLAEVGLINDEAYAQSVVRYCAGRMLGERGTLLELSRKGVDRALAQQAVNQARDAGVFIDSAWELGRRVAMRTAGLDPQVRRRRFWSAGGRKGHSPDVLRDVSESLFGDRPQ